MYGKNWRARIDWLVCGGDFDTAQDMRIARLEVRVGTGAVNRSGRTAHEAG